MDQYVDEGDSEPDECAMKKHVGESTSLNIVIR